MTLCQCGCGQEVKEGNKFLNHHNGRGRHPTEETKRKMSETRKKLFAEGKLTHWLKGKHHSEETKRKMRGAPKGRGGWSKGLTKETDERIKKKGEMARGKKNPKLSAYRKGRKLSEETKEKLRQIARTLWRKPEFKKKRCQAILKGLLKRPTSYEQRLIGLIQKHNLPFKYVGNGTCYINGRYPDFINTNGERVLLEVYHSYYKIKEYGSCHGYEQVASGHYSQYGFETIFLNENDLFADNWEERCLNKIMEVT